MAKEIIFPFSELKGTLNDAPIEPTLEITENGVYDVKGYSYADVNVEGGGSSDFSVAEVTILSDLLDSSIQLNVPNIYDDILYAGVALIDAVQETQLIPVYKNGTVLTVINAVIGGTTGDIQFDEQNPEGCFINGNGSITIINVNS